MKISKFNISDFNEYNCMYNSYLVLVGKASFEDLLEEDLNCAFIFDPTEFHIPMNDDAYDVLINYFEQLEQYNVCKELVEAKRIAKILITYQDF
ncbi:MAG TPA: hypothetical protein DCM10_09280 [Xanthomarina gelatinilytica]|nr:hypothetical protein [Phycisphaerae bacterium]HAI18185.1 hypothetical protein [Xanthomarina gelatinilytica]|tara:strand:- start:694 stop:975 length:282 start_codon:yes stop_codon:yes gene_type:complete